MKTVSLHIFVEICLWYNENDTNIMRRLNNEKGNLECHRNK